MDGFFRVFLLWGYAKCHRKRQYDVSDSGVNQTLSYRYCLELLSAKLGIPKAAVNLLMALCSDREARSVVELSLSPCFHYQYSSITDGLSRMADCSDPAGREALLLAHRLSFLEGGATFGRDHVLLQSDATPCPKAHSPTLSDRGYIYQPNAMTGQQPVNIGYDLSYLNLSEPASGWSLPLSIERVGVDQTATECILDQLQATLATPSLAGESLIVNTLDSKYGTAAYLCPSYAHASLVSVVRLRQRQKIYLSAPAGGRKIYGDCFYLIPQSCTQTFARHVKTGLPYEVAQRSIFEHPADEQLTLQRFTASGRELRIELWRWHDLRLRTKKGHNMKDKPLDLLAAQVFDAHSGQRLFSQGLYLAISGQQRGSLATEAAYDDYRHRYDIEPYFRFSKQRLHLTQYQTPDCNHLDQWLLIQQLATFLLFLTSTEVGNTPHKWQQYLPREKNAEAQPRLTIAQTHRTAQAHFLTFDLTPFYPQKSKSGRPRQKGETRPRRERYPVVKKSRKKAEIPKRE